MPHTFASLKKSTLRGARILVVDDDTHLRQVMVSILNTWGSVCIGVGSAEEAGQHLAEHAFDAMLLDLHLPGLSGSDFMRSLRADEKHELLPVLMVTGDPALASKRLAYATGVDSYMVKPFDAETLLLTLCSMLSKQRIVSTLERSTNLLMALGNALEAKDQYTLGHSDRVSLFSRNMGELMGLDKTQVQTLAQGGLLHDIGKIGTSEAVLRKAGPLTPEERREIQAHPERGAIIVGNLTTMEHTIPIIRSHHERYDGSGYPDGLRGEEIPLLARITAYADVYDALTSSRPYRDPFGHTRALEIIRQDAERELLDPALYGYFEQIVIRSEERALQS